MAGSLNKVMLIGNLGNDPEVRSTQDGRSLCTFSIATTESWKDKNSGERRDKTEPIQQKTESEHLKRAVIGARRAKGALQVELK